MPKNTLESLCLSKRRFGAKGPGPTTEKVYREVLNLLFYSAISSDDQVKVARSIHLPFENGVLSERAIRLLILYNLNKFKSLNMRNQTA